MLQAVHAHAQLTAYVHRYRARLLGKNIFYCEQVLLVMERLAEFMRRVATEEGEDAPPHVLSLAGLLKETRLTVNLFQLLRYLQKAQLSRKVGQWCAGLGSGNLWCLLTSAFVCWPSLGS